MTAVVERDRRSKTVGLTGGEQDLVAGEKVRTLLHRTKFGNATRGHTEDATNITPPAKSFKMFA